MLKHITALQALAQSGLHYTKDQFDVERYNQIQGIVAEMLSKISTYKKEVILDLFHKEYGYATPKIDVRGAVFEDAKILLVKEKDNNLWSLPGGWADVNLSPSDNVVKEISEESGIKTKVIKLVAIHDKLKHEHPPELPHTYKLFFICEKISGKISSGLETSDVAYFDVNNLPPLSLNRVIPKQIEMLYKHKENINLPTEFD